MSGAEDTRLSIHLLVSDGCAQHVSVKRPTCFPVSPVEIPTHPTLDVRRHRPQRIFRHQDEVWWTSETTAKRATHSIPQHMFSRTQETPSLQHFSHAEHTISKCANCQNKNNCATSCYANTRVCNLINKNTIFFVDPSDLTRRCRGDLHLNFRHSSPQMHMDHNRWKKRSE